MIEGVLLNGTRCQKNALELTKFQLGRRLLSMHCTCECPEAWGYGPSGVVPSCGFRVDKGFSSRTELSFASGYH
jgi:hypothetical protein